MFKVCLLPYKFLLLSPQKDHAKALGAIRHTFFALPLYPPSYGTLSRPYKMMGEDYDIATPPPIQAKSCM